MAYLGQTAHETLFTNRVTDTMTGDGSDTTLTLSSAPISVNNVIVFIDGVMQRPTTDYTVSGTTLTFATAPHNNANVQAITGGGEHIGVPLALITEDQLVDGVVTSAKLESGIQISADKITSLAASKITGALPALDGSALTGMSPDGVGIDNVTTNPSPTTNPSGGVGTIHLNKTTGEMFVCTNATANNNIWFNVGEGSGDISNATPTNPTSTNSFPDIQESSSQTFTFSGATDADGSVTHYLVDQISNAALTVPVAEVAATTAHTFNTGAVGSDTAVTFRVRSKDNIGAYSSGVTVSMNVTNTPLAAASGGDINGATDGNFKYHVFNNSGTFTVSLSDATFEYLVVAGGGGGGSGWNSGGGGGAGGYLTASSVSLNNASYSVTVGAGGTRGSGSTGSTNGANSVLSGSGLSTVTSIGGGYGGHTSYFGPGSHATGGVGGSGGGGGTYTGNGAGGAGTSGQGNAGGATNSPRNGAGGGGGASAAGQTGPSANNGGYGGAGSTSSITGSSVPRAGGGGGAAYTSSGYAAGGNGGGGNGGSTAGGTPGGNTGSAGTANTGGGGGGGNYNGSSSPGSAGGKGVVIIRYRYQ